MSPALQTLHSSSAEPSATAMATATPPHQTSASSPPLVLGCLALGLFSGAMLMIFGWKRIRMRGWIVSGISAAEVLSGNVINIPMAMKKPKLVDLWNEGQPEWEQVAGLDPGYGNVDGQWAKIMPLSAKAVNELDPYPPAPGPAVPTSLPAFGRNNIRRQSLQGEPNLSNCLPRAWRWRSSTRDINTLPPPPEPPQPSTKLQVGVAIMMPSPQFPLYVKEWTSNDAYAYHKQEKHRKRNVTADFSIGIYECTWDES